MLAYHLLPAHHALSNIAMGRLKVSLFGDLNDPFELMAAEVKEWDYRQAIQSWKSTFHGKYGLLCFSKSWGNPVIWSHYADKHRGVCLGFEIDDAEAMSVNYSANRLPIRFVNHDPAQGLEEAFVQEMLCTKYAHWIYEDEVRLHVDLNAMQKEAGLYFHPFGEKLVLREVVLGPNCTLSEEQVRTLIDRMYGSGVALIRSRLAFKWFKVVPSE